MTPTELYRAGRLDEAIDAQIQEVKKSPGDQAKRLFLFELVAFTGDLDRARRQLDALKYEEVELETAAQSYRKLLDAEGLRRRLFAEGLKPVFFSDPPEHVLLRLEAVNRLREGNAAEATQALARAEAAAPAVRGQVNGRDVEALRDCDDLFGHVLEVMAQGRYFWVPLEQVETIAAKAPRFPRDLIWFPARLDLRDGATGEVFLPALYPNSHAHADPQVKLGHATDWKGDEGGPVLGVGLRQFLAGDEAIPLLEWREVKLEAATA